MKREAIGHTKMKRLCRRLDVPLYQGIGLMESLWHLTAREAPRGDLGRLRDEDIALAIDYRGDETKLIEALCAAGWLDRDPENRLVIHDWHEHCEDSVNMRLARAKLFFANGAVPKTVRLPSKEKEAADAFYAACAQEAPSVRTEYEDVSTPEAQSEHAVIPPCVPPSPSPSPSPEPLLNTCSPPESGGERAGELSPTNSQKEIIETVRRVRQVNQWFGEWWSIYWLHVAKATAEKAFRKHVKTMARFEQVMAATRAQKPEMMTREKGKRPHGATWLNAERWDDEIEADEAVPNTSKQSKIDSDWESVKNRGLIL